MTGRPSQEHPDWLIPAVLVLVGFVVGIALVAFFAVRPSASEDDTLAGQMERWTTCLRSEGAPVPLVEAVGEEGFRVTVDEFVLDARFDFDTFAQAFEACLDDAPDGVRTIADVIDGLSSLPLGGGDLGWLGPLLFDIGSSGVFGDSETGVPPLGDPPLDELCAQLSDLEVLVPDLARELRELCPSGSDV
ncbi:MAG: hypothetical protein ABFR53_08190 [Actinomycetota bacterium]